MSTPPEKSPAAAGALSPRDWLGKASAGALLGFTLALGLSGLFAWFAPGALQLYNAKHQLAMWSIGLSWNVVLATCFLFRDGRRAWLWLGLANLLCYGLLFGGRALMS